MQYQLQVIIADPSLPAVWDLVQTDFAGAFILDHMIDEIGIEPEKVYAIVLSLLPLLRRMIDPSPNTHRGVLNDMESRNQMGIERYGSPLRPFCDTMPPLVDAYEELLDAAVYLRQAIAERAVSHPVSNNCEEGKD